MDGKSLLPVLRKPKKKTHEQLAFINAWGVVPTQSLTCLSEEWKYTYWWYGDAEMKPTEELYNLADDPLELKNLANNSEAKAMLDIMREKYDAELLRWKEEAVSYNHYQQYVTLFDRSIPWEDKEFTKKKNNKAH